MLNWATKQFPGHDKVIRETVAVAANALVAEADVYDAVVIHW